MDRTQQAFEAIINIFTDPSLVRVYTGPLPAAPDWVIDVPLLIDLLSDYYEVEFHDHGDGTVHV